MQKVKRIERPIRKATGSSKKVVLGGTQKCPHCNKGLRFFDLVKPVNDDGSEQDIDRVSIAYVCDDCERLFIGSGETEDTLARAIHNAETFNMKEMEKITKKSLDIPKEGEPMSYLGKLAGLIYISDKEGKKGQQYIHECGKDDSKSGKFELPHWAYYPGKNGGCFIIWGGAMRIDLGGESKKHDYPGWLVD